MPGTFCVECGRSGPTYGGLCQDHYGERRVRFEPPERVDLPECVHCGRVRTAEGWSDVGRDAAADLLIAEATKSGREVLRARYRHVSEAEDERNSLLRVTAILRVEDFDLARTFATRLRVQGATCPHCSRRRGNYYEAILQVRTSTGRLPRDLRGEVARFVEAGVASVPEAFITREETVPGGIDFYLSSGSLGKGLAKALRETYGAETKASAKIHGREAGKDLYRTTYLVRIPTPGAQGTGGRARSRRSR